MEIIFEQKNLAFTKKLPLEQAGLCHATWTALTQPFAIEEDALVCVAPLARATPHRHLFGPEKLPKLRVKAASRPALHQKFWSAGLSAAQAWAWLVALVVHGELISSFDSAQCLHLGGL